MPWGCFLFDKLEVQMRQRSLTFHEEDGMGRGGSFCWQMAHRFQESAWMVGMKCQFQNGEFLSCWEVTVLLWLITWEIQTALNMKVRKQHRNGQQKNNTWKAVPSKRCKSCILRQCFVFVDGLYLSASFSKFFPGFWTLVQQYYCPTHARFIGRKSAGSATRCCDLQ